MKTVWSLKGRETGWKFVNSSPFRCGKRTKDNVKTGQWSAKRLFLEIKYVCPTVEQRGCGERFIAVIEANQTVIKYLYSVIPCLFTS